MTGFPRPHRWTEWRDWSTYNRRCLPLSAEEACSYFSIENGEIFCGGRWQINHSRVWIRHDLADEKLKGSLKRDTAKGQAIYGHLFQVFKMQNTSDQWCNLSSKVEDLHFVQTAGARIVHGQPTGLRRWSLRIRCSMTQLEKGLNQSALPCSNTPLASMAEQFEGTGANLGITKWQFPFANQMC